MQIVGMHNMCIGILLSKYCALNCHGNVHDGMDLSLNKEKWCLSYEDEVTFHGSFE